MAAVPSPTAVPAARRPPRLRVVSPPRHTARYVACLLVVVAAGVFGVVSLNALAAESAFTARALEAEVRELTHRYEELTAEVAALESPERVRHVAVAELGMVVAEEPGFLVAIRPLSSDGAPEHIVDVSGRRIADPLKPMLGSRP